MSKLTALLCALALVLGCHKSVRAQVSVAPAPVAHMQFLDANGNPLAGGKVFTYLAGTTTLENTYADGTGIPQNTDPIILDAGGFANIFLANKSYKFVVKNSANVSQWTADNITGYLGLLNLSNTWTFAQLFSQLITVLPSDNQIVLGVPGSQTIFDAPPASGGGVTLHNQTGQSDTYLYRNSTDIVCCKTFTAPTINNGILNTPTINGTAMANGPATYVSIPNNTTIGTVLHGLAKLISTNPASARVTSSGGADTAGAIGVVVSGAGSSGNALIQQSGLATCLFDGNTTAGDYVQISAGFVELCHDVGSTFPTSGQVIGRATATTSDGASLYPLMLFGPEIQPGPLHYPRVVFSLELASNAFSSDTGAVMATPTADTTYRFSAYVHQVSAGTSCSGTTSINLFLTINDPLSGSTINVVMPFATSGATVAASSTIAIATSGNGAAGDFKGSVLPTTFRAKNGTNVNVTSTYSLGASCVVKPQYAIEPLLEQMAAN